MRSELSSEEFIFLLVGIAGCASYFRRFNPPPPAFSATNCYSLLPHSCSYIIPPFLLTPSPVLVQLSPVPSQITEHTEKRNKARAVFTALLKDMRALRDVQKQVCVYGSLARPS